MTTSLNTYGINSTLGLSFHPQLAIRKLAAQDDGLVGVLKNLLVGCVKTTKIKKVTTSPNDTGWGGILAHSSQSTA